MNMEYTQEDVRAALDVARDIARRPFANRSTDRPLLVLAAELERLQAACDAAWQEGVHAGQESAWPGLGSY